MSNDNKLKFMISSNLHITNLNRALKNIKSNIIADFVWSDQHGLIIITDKVASLSDLHTIKNYVKNADNMNTDDILTPQLSQFKFYLKIIDILYLMENTNVPINSSIVSEI